MTAAKAIAFCMRESVETHWVRVAGLQQWEDFVGATKTCLNQSWEHSLVEI